MRLGWSFSLIAHLAFVLAGLVVWPHMVKPMPADDAVVPVEVVNFAERANVTPIAPKVISEEAPAPAESGAPQESASETPPESAEAIAPVSVKPPPKKQEKPPQQFNMDQLALLIDRAKKNPGQQTEAAAPKAERGEKPRRGFGAQTENATTEIAAMQAQMRRCWRKPVDMPNYERLVVKVRVSLQRDGSLAAQPQLSSFVGPGDAPMRVAAENALRAVRMCAPYELPAATYARWRDMELIFNPNEQ
ncbi:MAG: hypothetical protein AB7M12_05925 [Hyphomonadaceae bacterium]